MRRATIWNRTGELMSAARHMIALLKSHLEGDDKEFLAVAMQAAAHEARLGHVAIAQHLRDLIDESKRRSSAIQSRPGQHVVLEPRGELASLLSVHSLSPRRKPLSLGPPGSVKTMTASALVGELQLPLFTIMVEGLITKFMGETTAKLRLVFKAIRQTPGRLSFDEFDALGAHRSQSNDVGEIRRVLNSFLQLLETDTSQSLISQQQTTPRGSTERSFVDSTT